jgi:NitT/TauT family transport system substrate-binding protein
MDKNTDQAQRFSVAYLRGARDFTDALRGGPKRAEVISILAKYTNLKDAAIYDKINWTWMDPNGEVSVTGMSDQQDWYAANGFVTKKVDVEEMIDRRFLDHALKQLGRVN